MRRSGLLLAAFALATLARGDTVVTKDGRRFTGDVAKRDTEYVVKTRFGEVRVGINDFDQLIKDSPTPPTPVPARATTPSANVASPTATAIPGKKVDPKTIDALLKQGRDALAAGEYKSARDAFSDAAAVDLKNVVALHGLADAYMYLNDFSRGREPMEKAISAAGPSANRALVLNACVCQIALKNPMRGAKIVMDYLTAHSKDLDEPMLNAMGTALAMSDAQAKKARLFQDCANFYIAYNARVEAQRPGYKRWGVNWLRAHEVDKKVAANAAVDKEIARLDKELDAMDAQVDRQQHEVDVVRELVHHKNRTAADLADATKELNRLTDARTEKLKGYPPLYGKILRPTFPRAMTLVAMDDLTPPPVTGTGTTIAVAESDSPFAQGALPMPSRRGSPAPADTAAHADEPLVSIAAQQAPKKNVLITTYAAAFPVAEHLLLTAAAQVARASTITVQSADGTPMKAELVRADEASGLALLRVNDARFAPLGIAPAFAGGPVQCAGYPHVNIFDPIAEFMAGNAKPPPPPAASWKITLTRHPRLSGSPVLAANKVIGVELAARDTDPANIPAASLEQIRQFLGSDLPSTPTTAPDPCAAMLQLMATRESSND